MCLGSRGRRVALAAATTARCTATSSPPTHRSRSGGREEREEEREEEKEEREGLENVTLPSITIFWKLEAKQRMVDTKTPDTFA